MTETTIDREILFKQMEKATDELLSALSSFNQDNINRIPFAGSWTAGQVGEHLLKSYGVVETLNGRVEETRRDPLQNDAMLKDAFLNFDVKMNAPDFILPEKKDYPKQQLINSLKQRIDEIKHAIQSLELTATCVDFALPNLGALTRIEWLNFVVYHTKRHTHQLKKIFDLVWKN